MFISFKKLPKGLENSGYSFFSFDNCFEKNASEAENKELKARKTSAVSAVPPAELAKFQKEITDLKKEKEDLTKTVKSFEKDKLNWQKQSEDLSGARKDLSSIKKDKDNLSQSLKVVERDLKKVLKDIQPKKVILDYDMIVPGHSVQRMDSTL